MQNHPDSVPALSNLARLELVQGNVDAAVRGYRRVLELAPSDPSAHCALAQALAAQGETAEAERQRAEARRLAGDPAACPG